MNKKRMKLLYNIAIGVLLIFCLGWVVSHFVHFGNVEFTDNAQVKQQIVPINSRVQGYIKKIYFNQYQSVKRGDTLLVIEDIEYRVHLAQAEADYQNALAGQKTMGASVRTAENNIQVSNAGIEECRIRMENAKKEFQRYETLLAQKAVTKQQYDNIKADYDATKARYEQVKYQNNSTSLVKDEQALRLDQTNAQIKLAEASRELARLNLSYTIITAPCDGVAGRKNIEEGQFVQPGQSLLDLVNNEVIWVETNYKETQMPHIKEGNEVEIKVDAVPNVTFKGTVQSISKATGANFSMFPQDNSSGNFVKVEQRIPVRIIFSKKNTAENMKRLISGMNVECEVKY